MPEVQRTSPQQTIAIDERRHSLWLTITEQANRETKELTALLLP
jgi:hypothetical protein